MTRCDIISKFQIYPKTILKGPFYCCIAQLTVINSLGNNQGGGRSADIFQMKPVFARNQGVIFYQFSQTAHKSVNEPADLRNKQNINTISLT